MLRSGLATTGLIAIVLLLSACAQVTAPYPMESSAIQVTVSAPHTTMSYDERESDPEKFDLPLLYLHRERQAMPETDRTLDIQVAGLPAGTPIQMEAQSRHVDVTTGERHTAAKRFVLPDRPCTSETLCTVHWTFDAATALSDLYDLRLKDAAGTLLWEKRSPDRPDFVMLDTWDVGLDDYIVRVYYAPLFPFAKAPDRLDSRLTPAQVVDFIEGQFVPIVRDTWHTQMHAWGFGEPIHPDWDEDKIVEIFITAPPFALFDGTGTYVPFEISDAPPHPQRRVWWLSTQEAFSRFRSLSDGHKAVLSHEFFHLAQFNAVLSAGCSKDMWHHVFIEAQAMFAPSVQYPELESKANGVVGAWNGYVSAAGLFLTMQLNTSYRDLDAETTGRYDAALYWRFLYEGFKDMRVVRAALEEMGCHHDPDIVVGIGEVMDRAFQRFDGPYHSFEESLVAFARANYGLWLENGRCAAADLGACDGLYYDPEGIYVSPLLEAELRYDGAPLSYEGDIPASFGMDFIELRLDPAVYGQPLTVKFEAEGSVARYNVEIWKLASGSAPRSVKGPRPGPGPAEAGPQALTPQSKPRAVTPQPEPVAQSQDGAHVYVIPNVDTTAYDRLALIITRLDAAETTDPIGKYRVTIDS